VTETSLSSAPRGSTQSQSLAQQGSGPKQGALQLRDQIDERTSEAGEQVRSFADALRRTGRELSRPGTEGMTKLSGGLADRLERMGGYLERVRSEELVRDAERFARKRPWLVSATAAAVGLAASRLLKASSESRYDESNGDGGSGSSWQPASHRTGSSESDPLSTATPGSAAD